MTPAAVPAVSAFWLRTAPRIDGGAARVLGDVDGAMARLRALPDYAPTPLRALRTAAHAGGVAQVWLKDEATRFGAGSFKALGAVHALGRALERTADPGSVTVTCATDGNHGRAVAWAAKRFGARAVVFMPDHALDIRIERIRALDADVRLVAGNYDEAVAAAHAAARAHGWLLLSDTSDDPNDPCTLDVMSGYALMVDEALAQMGGVLPTHVFLQAGVGTFAGAVIAELRRRPGAEAIHFIIVEPAAAPCVLRSLDAGAPTAVTGSYATVMDCLAAGRVSAPAWPILDAHVSAALALTDEFVAAYAKDNDVGLGPSGLSGLAGFSAASASPALRRALALDERSRVLLFGTEEPLGRSDTNNDG